jgi:alanyl-tRNA synthetase
MALFGEKYGETVRVIKFGNSVELCGGTHVRSTGNIGMVRILSENSTAAGIRRIEAVTGEAIEKLLDTMQDKMLEIQEFFGNTADLRSALKKIIDENSELRKQADEFVQKQLAEYADKLLAKAFEIEGITLIKHISKIPTEQAKTLAFQLRNRKPEKLRVVIGSVFEGKPSLTVLLSDDLVAAGENAVTLVREAAKAIQGGGGGQPFFAQAGGKNVEGIEKAVAACY